MEEGGGKGKVWMMADDDANGGSNHKVLMGRKRAEAMAILPSKMMTPIDNRGRQAVGE